MHRNNGCDDGNVQLMALFGFEDVLVSCSALCITRHSTGRSFRRAG
jgi:hypothetical protein